jgi:ferredoxin
MSPLRLQVKPEHVKMLASTNPPLPVGLSRINDGEQEPADGTIYNSRGVLLVAGRDAASAAEVVKRVLAKMPKLRVAVFAPGIEDAIDLPRAVTRIGGCICALKGHLGTFSASAMVGDGKQQDVGIFSVNPDRHFDLVIDLLPTPLLKAEVPPFGYFAVGQNNAALELALNILPALVGTFHKPQFLDYKASLCAHISKSVKGCSRCLEVCAAEAIRSVGESIEVDPSLCQGCASCALVCPTGALSFPLPHLALPQGRQRILLVHEPSTREVISGFESLRVQRQEVRALAVFTELLWWRALGQGFESVILVMSPETPPSSRQLLEYKVREASAILGGIGHHSKAILVVKVADVGGSIRSIGLPRSFETNAPRSHSNSEGRRVNLLATIDQFSNRRVAKSVVVPLPSGAEFGKISIDSKSCTLCHACVRICPTQAISDRLMSTTALSFRESHCIQCGLCRAVCPERAITLHPRFMLDPVRRNEERVINIDELVPCVSCGTPFIGRQLLENSLKLMQTLQSAPTGGIEGQRMCPSCRQRKMMPT